LVAAVIVASSKHGVSCHSVGLTRASLLQLINISLWFFGLGFGFVLWQRGNQKPNLCSYVYRKLLTTILGSVFCGFSQWCHKKNLQQGV